MFEKLPFTILEQIERLQTRGLLITPEDNASHYLSHISYYRLGEYWYSMQYDKVNHIFKENSRFKDVISLSPFDRIQPDNNFGERLNSLFIKYPIADPNAMGMKPNWNDEKLWK